MKKKEELKGNNGISYQCKPSVIGKAGTSGITLVALVITIIVLLILAGITLVYVLGDNSIFKQALDAKIKTEIGKIEEQAGMIYSDKLIEKQTGKIENISNRDIVDELIKNGNQIEIRTVEAEGVTEISVEPTAVSMDTNKTATIKVKLEGLEDGYLYYAVIEGKYYKINFHNSNLIIQREATTPEGTVEELENVEVEKGYDTILVTNVQINQSTQTIEIASGTTYGSTTLRVKYGSKTANCTVTVEKQESDWEKIAKIAKEIAEGRTTQIVDSSSTQATVTVDGKQETIEVGQEFYVKHNNILRKVRVLGFKHDTLTNPTEAYGSGTTATTAGVSFEFVEFMIDTTKQMNSSANNTNGWAVTAMRTYLEGLEGIGQISEVCKTNIKQVNKPYIKIYNQANSVTDSTDRLWLLSCSEIGFPSNAGDVPYGWAVAKEGEQYQYYKGSGASTIKKTTSGTGRIWWLRSPSAYYGDFCTVTVGGNASKESAYMLGCVAPGFGI